jgi:riboflavin kinase/FMN adenylyltransferase
MLIIENIEDIPKLPHPITLTIGSFDGLHSGHQKLLARVREKATQKGTAALLTFANHPSTVLSGKTPAPALCSREQKLRLLELAQIDLVLLLPFSPELAKMPYELFIKGIKNKLPFSSLILGKGAAFGSGKKGDEQHVKALGNVLHFEVEYLPMEEMEERTISSGWVREEVEKGNLKQIEKLLGRPYALYAKIERDGSFLAKGLSLLPEGTYQVRCIWNGKEISSVAKIDRRHAKIHVDLSRMPDYTYSDPLEIIFSKQV